MSAIDNVLAVAGAELGVHEEGGNNIGPRVQQYQAATGGGAGDAWCADFVAWCMYQAGITGWPKSGYCPYLQSWSKTAGIQVTSPQRGDVFLHLDPDGVSGHTGFVTSVNAAAGTVNTIEGNSDPHGQPFDGVNASYQRISECVFVRWFPSLAPLEKPDVPAVPGTLKAVFAAPQQPDVAVVGLSMEIVLADGRKLRLFEHT